MTEYPDYNDLDSVTEHMQRCDWAGCTRKDCQIVVHDLIDENGTLLAGNIYVTVCSEHFDALVDALPTVRLRIAPDVEPPKLP